jgi:multicomponent Na+:H+ antiporter subunit B
MKTENHIYGTSLRDSIIFTTISTGLVFLVNIFAIYLLLRGHNLPGGGFIAGVCSAVSLILLGFAIGLPRTVKLLRFEPMIVGAIGLILAVLPSIYPLILGKPFFFQYHFKYPDMPVVGNFYFGSPLIFDVGVYLVVVSVVAKTIFLIGESTSGFEAVERSQEEFFKGPNEVPIELAPPTDVPPPQF